MMALGYILLWNLNVIIGQRNSALKWLLCFQ
jgi:hypothetical protein